MSKHTPWKQAEDEFSIFVENSRGEIIADVRPLEMNMEEHRQRARLFAAAPEMLGALNLASIALQAIDPSKENPSAQNAMRVVAEAITKADGK